MNEKMNEKKDYFTLQKEIEKAYKTWEFLAPVSPAGVRLGITPQRAMEYARARQKLIGDTPLEERKHKEIDRELSYLGFDDCDTKHGRFGCCSGNSHHFGNCARNNAWEKYVALAHPKKKMPLQRTISHFGCVMAHTPKGEKSEK